MPDTPPPERPKTIRLLALWLGVGSLIGVTAGWINAGTSLRQALDSVSMAGWFGQDLNRLVALEISAPLKSLIWCTLAGALAGIVLSLLLVAVGRRPAMGTRGPLGLLVCGLGLLVLTAALVAETTRIRLVHRSADDRPNIVLVVVDALRADHLGCYGYNRNTSPYLDDLAASSTLFELALSQESYTMASAASYLTSLYPPQTGVLYDKPGIDALDTSFVTLAEVLKDAGYDTGAFVFNPHLEAKYQFGQGFDVYDDRVRRYPGEDEEEYWRLDEQSSIWEGYETVGPMQHKIKRFFEDERFANSERPRFFYMHYRDVHGPYIPPPDYAPRFFPDDFSPELRNYLVQYQGRSLTGTKPRWNPPVSEVQNSGKLFRRNDLSFLVSQYDGEIRYTDDGIKQLFELLAQHGITRENSIIVITADHGEEFLDKHPGDKPDWSHGRTLYIEQVRVPLIVSVPKRLGNGNVVSQPVELVDIAPTVLEAAGLADHTPVEFQGRSLLPLVEGHSLPSRPVYAGGNHGRGLILGDGLAYYRYETDSKFKRRYYGERPDANYKYSMRGELYDIEADPTQRRNLLNSNLDEATNEQAQAMKKLLGTWVTQQRLGRGVRFEPDEDEKSRLRALGYLGDGDGDDHESLAGDSDE